MKTPLFIPVCMLISMLAPTLVPAQEKSPVKPLPVVDKTWFRLFAQQKRQVESQRPDILFVGDSLTEYWTSTGLVPWTVEFGGMNAANFGISADRAENILYRLINTSLDKKPPHTFVLLAGTNNLSRDTPDSPELTVMAISAILVHLTTTYPGSDIILLTLPPNGYEKSTSLNQSVLATNFLLKGIQLPANTALLDAHHLFADQSHAWKPGMTLDGTHFTEHAYETLARAIKPLLGTAKSTAK